jgi:hypothetical protein
LQPKRWALCDQIDWQGLSHVGLWRFASNNGQPQR